MEASRELIVYIAMSLDGYIAGEEHDLSFLDAVATSGEDYGYHQFISTVDTVVMGRKTYEVVKKLAPEFPHKERQTYILTTQKGLTDEDVTFVSDPIVPWMRALKKAPGKHIFCDGGAQVVQYLLKNQLIDRLIVSVIPVVLGKGTRLFGEAEKPINLTLEKSESFASGLVQLNYRIIHR